MTDPVEPAPTEHRLVDDTLTREPEGIVARCVCGWVSRPHFSSMTASLSFQKHHCQHGEYRGMTAHGRCCPTCGTFMVDFGD